MKILVVGSDGMLGSAVVEAARAHEGVWTLLAPHSFLDITSMPQVDRVVAEARADVVVNCAGVIPLRGRPPSEMVAANAYGPHLLAEAVARHGGRLLHVSTDCVFSGELDAPGRYEPWDDLDGRDVYGRSKIAGEPEGDHVTIVRTSFIGPTHGLWRWLADQPTGAVVEGWQNALWTGSTVWAVAEALLRHIAAAGAPARLDDVEAPRVQHLASEVVVSKYEVLVWLKEAMGRSDLDIVWTPDPTINRALAPTIPLPGIHDRIVDIEDWARVSP